ncbi:hypothetical protein CRYUN_Cryun12cG0048600 [Craigia yunnanensis]
MVCFREGGPPLPDVSDAFLDGLVLNGLTESAGGIQYLQNVDQCYPLKENITFMLTCGQTQPGVYYFGLFNGLGLIRTQSKMINTGSSYTISTSVIVEGCWNSTVWGQYCNQTVVAPKCVEHSLVVERFIACGIFSETSCHKINEQKDTYVDVLEITEQLVAWVGNVTFNQALRNTSGSTLMCYARCNAIPDETVYDYYGDIKKYPLIIQSPKVGKWYFIIHPIFQSNGDKGVEENDIEVCYSVDWEMIVCPQGKTGPSCSWKRHMLQAVAEATPTVPFIYLPKIANVSLGSTDFSVEPLLSKTSQSDDLGHVWTYFLVHTSDGAAGKNIHVQLTSDVENFYELFIRFGGLPFLEIWDYYYLNQTLSSTSTNHSIFKLYDSDGKKINIYILYAREGPWIFGLRNPVFISSTPLPQTTMSISVEECVNQCSKHGTCQPYEDAIGSTSYSPASCILGHLAEGKLPFSQSETACAESIVLMASGVLSAIYHACDVGWWCALPFSVLQFMDFWLSFMAAVSVFVYLVIISEAAKRTVHTIVAITTALLAASDPNRATNIVLVVAAAFLALLVGCVQEYYIKHMSFSSSLQDCPNISMRQQNTKEQVVNLAKRLYEYYHWSSFLLGFLVLSMAAISWKLQTSETYWFWHSLWHMAVYISAFLFLCSKATIKGKDDSESQVAADGNHATYEFARLNSSQ